MAGLLMCPMHRLEGKCHRGCILEEHMSKAKPKVMAWKGAQAALWMVLGGWGSGSSCNGMITGSFSIWRCLRALI